LIKDGKIKNALTIVYKFDDTVYIKGKDNIFAETYVNANIYKFLKTYFKRWTLMGYAVLITRKKMGFQ
jgi:hypothetical protein